jgi:hypothetical protein
MADAHPDRGGTNEAFIEAHSAYLAAKWICEEDAADAQRRRREEAEAEAAAEERRQQEATEATARFRELAAWVVCACAAAFLVFAVVVALSKKHPVTADAGRHGDLAATGTTPAPQFAPSKPHEATGSVQEPPWDNWRFSSGVAAVAGGSAVSDGPETPAENASADKPRPVATVAAKEVDAAIRPALAEPPTPEQQAKSTVYAAMAAANTGSIDDTSHCYADAVTYYGKRMSKAEVIADNMKLWQRWPARNYTIRPDSLTASCYVIRRGTTWMNCDVKGVFDWEATNSSRQSVGSASITWTLMGPSNAGPLDLRIVGENSTVITRSITDIGKQRALQTAAPG